MNMKKNLLRTMSLFGLGLVAGGLLVPPLHAWVLHQAGRVATPFAIWPAYRSFLAQLPDPQLLFELAVPLLLFSVVRTLFRKGRDYKQLGQAVACGRTELVRELIEQGVDVNQRNAQGHTALHLAVRRGDRDLVQLLLDNGADLDVHEQGSGLAPLHSAARLGNPELCELLIRYGADPDALSATHDTALHLAAALGHADAVGILLKYRARPDRHNESGQTVEQVALAHPRVIDMLHRHASREWPYLKISGN